MAARHSRQAPSGGKGTFIGNLLTPAPTPTTSTSPTPPHGHNLGPDMPNGPGHPGTGTPPGGGTRHNSSGLLPSARGAGGGGGIGGSPNGYGTGPDLGGLPYYPREEFSSGIAAGGGPGGGSAAEAVAGAGGDTLSATASSFLAEAFVNNGTVTIPSYDYPCYDNDTSFCDFNISMGNETALFGQVEYKYWTILLIIFPFFTVFGNVLVVLSVVREKSLKTVTNYFICSLAVADIMVAVVVMPFAVYVEVVGGWLLSDPLCDAWVASDVMACTASILNLTAISVDRFIAVTQPIKYAKHKNSKRVYIMIALTWIISAAIALPIPLGVNYSENRLPGECLFYNADFIIYSSMGSFYIPSIIMIFLYWKIYRVIRQRAQKAQAAKRNAVNARALQNVIENTAATAPGGEGESANGGGNGNGGGGGNNGAVVNSGSQATAAPTHTEPTVTTGLAKMDNGRVTSYNTTGPPHRLGAPPVMDETSVSNFPSGSDSHNDDEDDSNANVRSPPTPDHATQLLTRQQLGDGDLGAELIANPGAAAAERREASGKASGSGGSGGSREGGSNEAETPFTSPGASGRKKNKSKNSCPSSSSRQKKGVTKFNFHMRTSRKRKEKSSSRREKKATKTLAIVLGVFLLCWVPFFTINIINAICIRYALFDNPACNLDKMLFSFFVWLGYINSFLNPVIYTIFNPEFRKAFKKILTEPCLGGGRRR